MERMCGGMWLRILKIELARVYSLDMCVFGSGSDKCVMWPVDIIKLKLTENLQLPITNLTSNGSPVGQYGEKF